MKPFKLFPHRIRFLKYKNEYIRSSFETYTAPNVQFHNGMLKVVYNQKRDICFKKDELTDNYTGCNNYASKRESENMVVSFGLNMWAIYEFKYEEI